MKFANWLKKLIPLTFSKFGFFGLFFCKNDWYCENKHISVKFFRLSSNFSLHILFDCKKSKCNSKWSQFIRLVPFPVNFERHMRLKMTYNIKIFVNMANIDPILKFFCEKSSPKTVVPQSKKVYVWVKLCYVSSENWKNRRIAKSFQVSTKVFRWKWEGKKNASEISILGVWKPWLRLHCAGLKLRDFWNGLLRNKIVDWDLSRKRKASIHEKEIERRCANVTSLFWHLSSIRRQTEKKSILFCLSTPLWKPDEWDPDGRNQAISFLVESIWKSRCV